MKILSMSGFVPEHICDTVRFTRYSGDGNISHYCGYASDFISQVLMDSEIDGAVYPKTCDSSRNISSYLLDTGKFIFQITVPYRNGAGAIELFAASIRSYKESVERYYGITIKDVRERCEILNRRNDDLRKLYESLDTIEYSEYLSSLHGMLNKPLREQIVRGVDAYAQSGNSDRKKVFLTGSFLSNIEIVKAIESVGFKIVGDNLPESGRLVSRQPVDLHGCASMATDEDLYNAIARSILSQNLSPSQNGFKELLERDVKEIYSKAVEAVIFISQKYCEPYDYLLPIYKEALGEIPMLHICVNDTDDMRKVDLELEAFADTL